MRKAFTLVEMLVAIAILGVMTVALFEVYSSVSFANRRLDRSRALTEAVRTSYEEIAEAVRSRGIDFSAYSGSVPGMWEPADYSGSGAAKLHLSGGVRYFAAKENSAGSVVPCDGAEGCFLAREEVYPGGVPASLDRLTPPEVEVRGLRFYVFGNSKTDGARGKATAVGTFDLVKRLKENPSAPGVPFQATVAERPYNRN